MVVNERGSISDCTHHIVVERSTCMGPHKDGSESADTAWVKCTRDHEFPVICETSIEKEVTLSP